MFGLKKKSHISIEITDYVVRVLRKTEKEDDVWEVVEIPLELGVVTDSTIVDEMSFYELLKENIGKIGGRRQKARIFVPDTSVLLKTFEHPNEVKNNDLKGYVQMELGRTIHLPFQDALVDVHDPNPNDGHAVLFAVPPEEVGKVVGILQDVNLEPEAADIRALCNVRLLESIGKINANQVYLIADWSINELNLCIYSTNNVEFLRYQSIETDLVKWEPSILGDEVEFDYNSEMEEYMVHVTEQVLELDRVLNFFRFSLHKGEKAVTEIIVMGDNPFLKEISDVIRENIDLPVQVINDNTIDAYYPQFKAKHASLIGLALKEV